MLIISKFARNVLLPHVQYAILAYARNVCGDLSYFGICSSCLPNCHTCSSQITCGKCFDGYYKRADEKECLPCDTNCAKCSGLELVLRNEGFYVDSDGLCSM